MLNDTSKSLDEIYQLGQMFNAISYSIQQLHLKCPIWNGRATSISGHQNEHPTIDCTLFLLRVVFVIRLSWPEVAMVVVVADSNSLSHRLTARQNNGYYFGMLETIHWQFPLKSVDGRTSYRLYNNKSDQFEATSSKVPLTSLRPKISDHYSWSY